MIHLCYVESLLLQANIGKVPFSTIIEILGTISFAMSGSFAAMQNKLDPFGVLIIAFATAVGGGTIRDLLIDAPIFWMYDMRMFSVIVVSSILAMIFKSIENNFKVTFFIFDSLGLGLFTIVGVEKGIAEGLHPAICVTLGTITGCFGGIMRDVLVNRVPLVLREEIYATACILGGAFFAGLSPILGTENVFLQIFTVATVFFTRHFSVKYHLNIPKFYLSSEEKMKKSVSKVLKQRQKKNE